MKNKLFIAIIILALVLMINNYKITPTGMIVADVGKLDFIVNNPDIVKQEYNDNIEYVPNFLRTIFGDEKILVHVKRFNDTEVTMSLQTEDAVIKNLTSSDLEDYTLDVYLNESIIEDITKSQDQVLRMKDALDKNEIKYETHSLKTSLKFGLSKIFLKMASLFV